MDIKELLKKAKRRTKTINLPGRGEITVRSLYESEKVKDYDNWFLDSKGKPRQERIDDIRLKLIILCVCDPEKPDEAILNDSHLSELRDGWTSAEVTEVYLACAELTKENADVTEGELKNSQSQ